MSETPLGVNIDKFDFDLGAKAFNAADQGSLEGFDYTKDYGLKAFNSEEFSNTPNYFAKIEADRRAEEFTQQVEKDTKSRLRRYSKKRRGGVLRYPLEAFPVTYLFESPGAATYPSPMGTYSSISICK